MAAYDLAQVNIMRLRAPLDSPELAPFVAALDPVNALAEQAPGFVWRLKAADGNSTSLRIFEDDSLIVNMSTWRSLEALTDYAYRSAHVDIMRRRREFAVPIAEAYIALWWVPRGHQPTIAEAEARLRHLRAHGPTAHAFGVRTPFPAPNATAAPKVRDDDACWG
ncbi:MAG TPA: DUF3291 domain-containing protein [Polyangia bacterium]|jgi:hypothetical protein|nr:DUF3291 domain-containing protein [Polyangia bacterium]